MLLDTVGADRVVLGTDWPADMRIDWPVAWVLGLKSLTQEEKEQILWKNLERLWASSRSWTCKDESHDRLEKYCPTCADHRAQDLVVNMGSTAPNTFRVCSMVPHGGRVDEAVCDGTSEAGGTE